MVQNLAGMTTTWLTRASVALSAVTSSRSLHSTGWRPDVTATGPSGDGDRAECADCSCERARRSYKPRDTGLMIIVCLHCGNEFEYVKTSGRRRLYCSDRCKYQAGDATKKQRAAVEIRTCTCGSLDVARVGKPVCPDCRKDPRDSETLRVKERRRTLRLYGLSETGWQELLARQGCRCAICHTADPGGRGQWMIDHDHGCCPGTGSCGQCVRGLLCNQFNLMLGFANDQPEKLRAALAYLLKGTAISTNADRNA